MAASPVQKGSVSEALFPFLMAALETCLVNLVLVELANLGFLGSSTLLIPLWLPFLLMASACWIVRYPTRRLLQAFPMLKQDAGGRSSPPLVALCLLLGVLELLFIICSIQYTPLSFDAGSFFQTSYVAVTTVAVWRLIVALPLAVFLCWRGVQLARSVTDSQSIKRILGLGLVIVVFFILLRGYQELFFQQQLVHDDVAFFFLLAMLVAVSLFAYPLGQWAYLFHFHLNDIRESFQRQEYLFLFLVGCFCLLGLIALWWVIALHNHWLVLQADLSAPIQKVGTNVYRPPIHPPKHTTDTGFQQILSVSFWMKIVAVVLLIGVIGYLLLSLIRRLLARSPRQDETHESLWSWSLFWQQLKAIVAALVRQWVPTRPHKPARQGQNTGDDSELSVHAIHTVRQLYSIFLHYSARIGQARRHNETPNEYRERLHTQLPFTEPYLEEITNAYIASRYGGYLYDETEMERLRGMWSQLRQKLQEYIQ